METSGIIRSITTRLRRYVHERRKVLRRGSRYEARLPFIITPLGASKLSGKRRTTTTTVPALIGHTRDLSETSLTLLLPSVRAGNVYLTDGDNCLEIKLELPGRPVSLLTNCVRFEQLPRKDAGCGYLLVVRIVGVDDDARARYLSYLKTVKKSGRRTRDRRQAPATTPAATKSAAQASTWDTLTPSSINNAFEQFLNK
jgi:hypothetical protein